MKNPYLVFWTCESLEEAREVAKGLVKKKLAACCSLIDGVESVFHWESEVQHAEEVKVIIKTLEDHLLDIQSYILEHSSYDNPEILFVPTSGGSSKYISWMSAYLDH